MKRNVGNGKLARALAIVLAAFIAVTGTPLTALAEEIGPDDGFVLSEGDEESLELQEDAADNEFLNEDQFEQQEDEADYQEESFAADGMQADGAVPEEEGGIQADGSVNEEYVDTVYGFLYKITKEDTDGHTVTLLGPNREGAVQHWSGFTIPYSSWVGETQFFVTAIADEAFKSRTGDLYSMVGSITFGGTEVKPSKLETIGDNAFNGQMGLTGTLSTPPSLRTIGKNAFSLCKFTGLEFAEGLESIGEYAFQTCQFLQGNLILPQSLKTMGQGAFENCDGFDGELVLSANTKVIPSAAFNYCSGFTGDLNIPYGVTEIENVAFQNCSGFDGRLTVPSTVTSIGPGAFDGCKNFGSIKNKSIVQMAASWFLNDDQYFLSNTGEMIGKDGFLGKGTYTRKTRIPITEFRLNKTSDTIQVGQTTDIQAIVKPKKATFKEVTWESDKTAVAEVNEYGEVTGKGVGEANIKATTGDGKSKICKIKVIPAKVTGVSVDPESGTIFTGKTLTLTATVSPAIAGNKDLDWKSSNTSVATVAKNGANKATVKGISPGTATITVTTKDGGKTATCKVTVNPVKVTGVKLDKTSKEILAEGSFKLTATISPADATNKKVKWSSSNKSVASVDQKGKVTGLKPGTATITATTEDGGKTASCNVTVKPIKVTGVKLNKKSIELENGKSYNFTVTVSPANATNKKVRWKSSNTDVAVVESGKVVGLKTGTATITVTTEDGGNSATCTVKVIKAKVSVTGIKLNKKSATISKGKSIKLTATVSPKNASNKKVKWTSSNNKVATVSSKGVVKGVKKGTAKIKVTTDDGKKTATCKITVK